MDDYVMQIKEYIAEHPVVNIVKIREDLKINERDLLYLIKEKRIELKAESLSGLENCTCVKCGKPTLGEKYCNDCKNEMAQSMMDASENLKQKIEKSMKSKGVVTALRDKQ